LEDNKKYELLDIFEKSETINLWHKESSIIYSGNEEKKYYLTKVGYNFDDSLEELSKIKFYHFNVIEMTKDKRLINEPYESKKYEILLSNKEYRKVFNIDLKKEKEKVFEKNFKSIFIQDENIETLKKEELKEDKTEEDENIETKQNINNKIKKIL
jgi:hypothetical protein